MLKAKVKRPLVVEAYMTHGSTPFITEVLRDGRIRKIGRHQRFQVIRDGRLVKFESDAEREKACSQDEAETLRAIYGNRWKGIQSVRLTRQLSKYNSGEMMPLEESEFVSDVSKLDPAVLPLPYLVAAKRLLIKWGLCPSNNLLEELNNAKRSN